MCDLISAGIAFAAISLAGTAVSIQGQQAAGKAAQQQAAFQAQVARNNAVIAKRAADDARRRGAIEEDARRKLTAQQIGRQRVKLAGSGQVVDEGSALDLIVDTSGVGEVDALTIRNNAEREALGFEIQGGNFAGNALLLVAKGKAARSAASTQAFGTLLTGFGRAGAGLSFGSGGGSDFFPSSTSPI